MVVVWEQVSSYKKQLFFHGKSDQLNTNGDFRPGREVIPNLNQVVPVRQPKQSKSTALW